MIIDQHTKVLIVGLGVIGGSYAAALSEKGLPVRAITRQREDLDYALARGMIEEGDTEVTPEAVAWAEVVVFALYPHVFLEWIDTYGHLLRPGTLVTDVTGVKETVVERVQNALPEGVEFIAAHPMAGRERSGVLFADPSVFLGANYIVTPTHRNTKEAIEACKQLGTLLGFSRISELSVKEHDEMIAFLSQLTHCIAVTLMNCNEAPHMERYTGDSFRDLTRIAKINDKMWSELFLLNRDTLLAQMDAFSKEFSVFRQMLAEGDVEGMREKMRRSTARRALFDKPKTNQ